VPEGALGAAPWDLTCAFAPIALGDAQQADCATWMTRNMDLVEDITTNPVFVYTTQQAHFADPVVPFIRCGQLPLADPGQSLQDALSQLLAPLVALGPLLDAEITLGVSYRFALVPALPQLAATQAVMLATALKLGGQVAGDLALEIAAWRTAQPNLSAAGAVLTFAITVYGQVDGVHRLLVEIPALGVDVHAVSASWWTS
ncbi:hypothetical protein DBR42_07405, partial [Pelomonas sp. HMWF004]